MCLYVLQFVNILYKQNILRDTTTIQEKKYIMASLYF